MKSNISDGEFESIELENTSKLVSETNEMRCSSFAGETKTDSRAYDSEEKFPQNREHSIVGKIASPDCVI